MKSNRNGSTTVTNAEEVHNQGKAPDAAASSTPRATVRAGTNVADHDFRTTTDDDLTRRPAAAVLSQENPR